MTQKEGKKSQPGQAPHLQTSETISGMQQSCTRAGSEAGPHRRTAAFATGRSTLIQCVRPFGCKSNRVFGPRSEVQVRAQMIQHFSPTSPAQVQLIPVMTGFYHCWTVLVKSCCQPAPFHSQQTNTYTKNPTLVIANCPRRRQHQQGIASERSKKAEIFSNCKGGTEAHGRKSLSYLYTETASAACANGTSNPSKFSGKII